MNEVRGSDTFDVVVAGGGPAGAAAATFIARKGLAVALLEGRAGGARDTGGSLLPQIWRFLDELGVSDQVASAGFMKKPGVTALWDGVARQFQFSWFGHSRMAVIVERARFDDLLRAHAAKSGVEVLDGTRVLSAIVNESGVEVDAETCQGAALTLRGRFLVGATGIAPLHGLSAENARRAVGGNELAYLSGRFRGGQVILPGGAIVPHPILSGAPMEATSYMCATPDGWALQLPITNGSEVSVAVPRRTLPEDVSKQKDMRFLEATATVPMFDVLLKDAAFEPGSGSCQSDVAHQAVRFAGTRYVLVGDAAAYADPIFAHGVQFALFSAFIAAHEVAHAVARNRDHVSERYDHLLRQHHQMSKIMALGEIDKNRAAIDLLRGMPQPERDLLFTSAVIAGRATHFEALAERSGVTGTPQFQLLEAPPW